MYIKYYIPIISNCIIYLDHIIQVSITLYPISTEERSNNDKISQVLAQIHKMYIIFY